MINPNVRPFNCDNFIFASGDKSPINFSFRQHGCVYAPALLDGAPCLEFLDELRL